MWKKVRTNDCVEDTRNIMDSELLIIDSDSNSIEEEDIGTTYLKSLENESLYESHDNSKMPDSISFIDRMHEFKRRLLKYAEKKEENTEEINLQLQDCRDDKINLAVVNKILSIKDTELKTLVPSYHQLRKIPRLEDSSVSLNNIEIVDSCRMEKESIISIAEIKSCETAGTKDISLTREYDNISTFAKMAEYLAVTDERDDIVCLKFLKFYEKIINTKITFKIWNDNGKHVLFGTGLLLHYANGKTHQEVLGVNTS